MGAYFTKYDQDAVREAAIHQLRQGRKHIVFKFAEKKQLAAATMSLATLGKFKGILRYAELKAGLKVSQNYFCYSREDRGVLTFVLK
jgi:hypothetical protein